MIGEIAVLVDGDNVGDVAELGPDDGAGHRRRPTPECSQDPPEKVVR